MKRLITLILIIAWALNANGQVVRDSTYLADSAARAEIVRQVEICHGCLIGIEGTDALGNKDTLYFGADTTANAGIDSRLGEVDVTNRSLKPMDMRFFQRPEVCLDNLAIGDSVPFLSPVFLRYRQSIELKSDFRSTWTGFQIGTTDTYTASSNKYVFKVSTQNYPITFRLIQKTGSNQFRDLRDVNILEFRNCRIASPAKYLSNISINDTARYNYQSSHYYLFGNIYLINSAKKKLKMELGVFPIPAAKKIQVTGLRSATSVSITSITGKETKIKNVIVRPESPEVNIEMLENGIYLLNYPTSRGNQIVKFIKQ